MARRRGWALGLTVVATAILFSACGTTTSPEVVLTLSDAEIAAYRAAVASIDTHLTDAPGTGAAEQFAASADWVRAQPGVESVLVAGAHMTVRFTSGLTHGFWVTPSEVSTAWSPPTPDEATRSRAIPGRANRALLVRSVSDDLNMMRQARFYLDRIKAFHEFYGTTVTVADQAAVDVALAKTFGEYGSVAYHGHGGPMESGPGIALGEKATDEKLKLYANDLKRGRLAVGTINVCGSSSCEWAGGSTEDRDVLVFTPLFVQRYYGRGSLPGTIVQAMTCYGMADNRLAQAFVDAGSLGFSGWTGDTSMGAQGGLALFYYLTDGGHLAAALTAAQASGFTSDLRHGEVSRLRVFPTDSTANLYTDDTVPQITITSPTPGQVIDTNLIQLRGRVATTTPLQWVNVNINGFVYRQPVAEDGSFSRDLMPQAGENTIGVVAIAAGGSNTAEVTCTVSGTPLPLWLNLGWNTPSTDLDLHLTAMNRDADALKTFQDCWSGFPQCFGARLNPEASNGYGPETISMASEPAAGFYRIWVQYVGEGPATTAQVTVVTPNNTIPVSRTLTAGDWWEVGAVTWHADGPDSVTVLDRLRPDVTVR